MNTQFIGIKDFRQKIAEYAKKASTNKTRYIVMSHKKPLFELKPFDEEETLDSFVAEIMEAKEDIAAGRVYSQEEVLAMFN
jgi:PHD/YefM family antitoxin component YafN of YafNO toxin-antitoxin module